MDQSHCSTRHWLCDLGHAMLLQLLDSISESVRWRQGHLLHRNVRRTMWEGICRVRHRKSVSVLVPFPYPRHWMSNVDAKDRNVHSGNLWSKWGTDVHKTLQSWGTDSVTVLCAST